MKHTKLIEIYLQKTKGWVDGLVCKKLPLRHEAHRSHVWYVSGRPAPGSRDRQIPGAHWLNHGAPGSERDPDLINTEKSNRGTRRQHLASTHSSTDIQLHAHTHTNTQTRTDTTCTQIKNKHTSTQVKSLHVHIQVQITLNITYILI